MVTDYGANEGDAKDPSPKLKIDDVPPANEWTEHEDNEFLYSGTFWHEFSYYFPGFAEWISNLYYKCKEVVIKFFNANLVLIVLCLITAITKLTEGRWFLLFMGLAFCAGAIKISAMITDRMEIIGNKYDNDESDGFIPIVIVLSLVNTGLFQFLDWKIAAGITFASFILIPIAYIKINNWQWNNKNKSGPGQPSSGENDPAVGALIHGIPDK